MGGDAKSPFPEAAKEYIEQHYPQAEESHCSIPSDVLLSNDILEQLLHRANEVLKGPNGEDVDLPRDHDARSSVFYKIKAMCGPTSSLVFGDYKYSQLFNELLQGSLSQMRSADLNCLKRERHIPELRTDSKTTFLLYPIKDKVRMIFFQTRETSLDEYERTVDMKIRDAIHACYDDKSVFRTLCGNFLSPGAIVNAFPSFPFIERNNMIKFLHCTSCAWKILTKDDLHSPEILQYFFRKNGIDSPPHADIECTPQVKKLFRNIFYLYVCGYYSVEIPPPRMKNLQDIHRQMEKTLRILTPEQKRLVDEDEKTSWLLLLAGGSGTGKTIVVEERAQRLAKIDSSVKVLVVHVPGGRLTKIFNKKFKGQL